ncbi:MAG TPA: hypothetical protein VIN57_03525 [Magnetovibrio sp.]
MMKPIDSMTNESLHAMLDYLSDEIEVAESKEDLELVLKMARELFRPSSMQNTVRGLNHILAEVDTDAIARTASKHACTVHLEVPHILSSTFQDLSERMNALQNDDPDTFANATSALTWLANGKINSN